MPTTYAFEYQLLSNGGNDYEVASAIGPVSLEVSDGGSGGDGVDNEVLTVGENVIVNSASVGQYVGNYDNEGVIYTNGGSFILMSNQPLSIGAIITVNSGAPLTVCFAAGTLIATPEGETAVEELQIGDMVTTAEGRMVPVKWIGRQTVVAAFAGERARPVRVAAGALGDGLPHSDLVLTADHALILDGLAINAGALVNGSTISFDPAPERATYYHIETEGHEVILANGAPAETYVDYIQRRVFDNYAEYLELYGDDRTITEMPLPRVSAARLVPDAIRARLAGRFVA